jgi:hypothetical protein
LYAADRGPNRPIQGRGFALRATALGAKFDSALTIDPIKSINYGGSPDFYMTYTQHLLIQEAWAPNARSTQRVGRVEERGPSSIVARCVALALALARGLAAVSVDKMPRSGYFGVD